MIHTDIARRIATLPLSPAYAAGAFGMIADQWLNDAINIDHPARSMMVDACNVAQLIQDRADVHAHQQWRVSAQHEISKLQKRIIVALCEDIQPGVPS